MFSKGMPKRHHTQPVRKPVVVTMGGDERYLFKDEVSAPLVSFNGNRGVLAMNFDVTAQVFRLLSQPTDNMTEFAMQIFAILLWVS